MAYKAKATEFDDLYSTEMNNVTKRKFNEASLFIHLKDLPII